MSIALAANIAVFFLRLYYPVPFHLHILAAAWLIISVTLGIVVTQAVFKRGRVTYHRIIGAILLYLLIAVAFATLFLFVGLLDHDPSVDCILLDFLRRSRYSTPPLGCGRRMAGRAVRHR